MLHFNTIKSFTTALLYIYYVRTSGSDSSETLCTTIHHGQGAIPLAIYNLVKDSNLDISGEEP